MLYEGKTILCKKKSIYLIGIISRAATQNITLLVLKNNYTPLE